MSDLNKKPAQPEKKPVKIVETVLRDAHQSLIATRMTTEQMLPIRRLPALPARGSVGKAQKAERRLQEDEAADAFPRPEHPRLQSLSG